MTDEKRPSLTLHALPGDSRSDREVLLETNRLVQQLVFRGAKTLLELEHSMRMVALPVSALELSSRTGTALAHAGIATVKELIAQTPSGLLQFESIGRLARNEIIEALATHGLRLADPGVSNQEIPCPTSEPVPEGDLTSVDTENTHTNNPSPPKHSVSDESLKKGDIVKHPNKPDWGIGRVQSITAEGVAKVLFSEVGEKNISLQYVRFEKVQRTVSAPPLLSDEDKLREPPPGKVLCSNCGQPTQFTEQASPQRYALGWCDACFKHSQRTFKDSVTGEIRYFDDLRTVDGIKNRYSPK